MKHKSQTGILLLKMIVLAPCFMVAVLFNRTMASEVPATSVNNNRIAINFKNNTEKNQLTIRVKSGTAATMQLFIFSPDGILIKEVAISANKKTTIKGLKRGYYLYECFNNDERLKSGNLLIK